MLKYIALFDTSIATDNLGDQIIMQAVEKEIREIYPKDFFVHIGTHDQIGPTGREFARKAALGIVGGTNLLCANWLYKRQWKVGLADFWRMGNPVLMGVGWHFYQRKTDFATRWMLRHLLSKRYINSVRDNYTEQRVREMGITNVINTGCPTMWNLTPEHCAAIPSGKAENAIITVTAYRHNPELDRQWIELVLSKYKRVYFWPQMFDDMKYAQDIAGNRLTILDASLAAYDDVLANKNVDFIGTRLHGGVRALQHKRRSLIIEVDNRATEISRDTGLPTVKRDDLAAINQWIEKPSRTVITMPWDHIARWKAQFLRQTPADAKGKPLLKVVAN